MKTKPKFAQGQPVKILVGGYEAGWVVVSGRWWGADVVPAGSKPGWTYVVAKEGNECICPEDYLEPAGEKCSSS